MVWSSYALPQLQVITQAAIDEESRIAQNHEVFRGSGRHHLTKIAEVEITQLLGIFLES